MNSKHIQALGLSPLLVVASAVYWPQIGLAQATITWGPAQDTSGPSDIASGGTVVEARNGLVFVPYLMGDPAYDTTVAGVTFDAINYLGAVFPNEPPDSFIAGHTSNHIPYDTLIGNLSSCDGVALGNGSTNANANYEISGLTVNEDYLVQIWYTDVRPPFDLRAMTIDGVVTLESGVNADPNDLGQFAIGTFTASAATQLVNINAAGTAGRAAMTAILVRVNTGDLGTSYCGPAPVNSTGASGVILASGSNVVAFNDVTVTAAQLPPNAFGFFITSQTQGFVMNPAGSQGNLCLGGMIGRYVGQGQIQNSGPMGSFSLVLDLTQTPQPTGFVSITSGETWSFQAWHRDSIGGMATSNFTDGVEIPFI